jgi:hypothetical protein
MSECLFAPIELMLSRRILTVGVIYRIAGTSPRLWRLAMDIASGELRPKHRNRADRIFRILDHDDITFMYGPFLDFWAVCIKHVLVFAYYIIFLR